MKEFRCDPLLASTAKMHHALEIEEIISNIFRHCTLPNTMRRTTSDLPALARACRTFKEPALSVLWGELVDLSPLARCLPAASHPTTPARQEYSFSRSLTQTEWNVLQSYTCRIRFVSNFARGLNWGSVQTFLNPLPTEPLFPNLRHLDCGYLVNFEPTHLLHPPLPSLTFFGFTLVFEDDMLGDSPVSFPKIAPNTRRLFINVPQPRDVYSRFASRYVSGSRWCNLREVFCSQISLDANALVHLSQMPALAQLTFTLNAAFLDQIASPNSPLIFPAMIDLRLHTQSLTSILRLFPRIRLPVIANLGAFVEDRPFKWEVSSFFAAIDCTIQRIRLFQTSLASGTYVSEGTRPRFVSRDLQPCTSFGNLRGMNIMIDWDLDVTEKEVLSLASAWPNLERLVLNDIDIRKQSSH